MKSVSLKIDKRRRTYTRLIGEIHHALNRALTEENEDRQLTKAKMAEILGCDRGTITKLLSGTRNMRLETLADLAFALDRPVEISLPSRKHGTNLRPPSASDASKPVDIEGVTKKIEAEAA